MNILVINGPNLNLLGEREPEIYGDLTLEEINSDLSLYAKEKGIDLKFMQSNHEGELVDAIHEFRTWAEAILVNPGALAYTSYSIADAIRAAGLPAIEVHLSNLHRREEFRTRSVIAGACIGQIVGLGPLGYKLGLNALVDHLEKRS